MHHQETSSSTQVDVGACMQPPSAAPAAAQVGTMTAVRSVGPALAALAAATAGSAVLEMGAIASTLNTTSAQPTSEQSKEGDEHASPTVGKKRTQSVQEPGSSGGAAAPAPATPPPPPPPHQQLNCPRCGSKNTKFCYYNNYSVSQPRHYCKSCRRYWTQGGALRDVPVGGGCRKNKRSASAALASKMHYNYRAGIQTDPDHTLYMQRSRDTSDPSSLVLSSRLGTAVPGLLYDPVNMVGQLSNAQPFLGSRQCTNSFNPNVVQLDASFLSGPSAGGPNVGHPFLAPLQLYDYPKFHGTPANLAASLENQLCPLSNYVPSINDSQFHNANGATGHIKLAEDAAKSSIRSFIFEDHIESDYWSHSTDMQNMNPFSL